MKSFPVFIAACLFAGCQFPDTGVIETVAPPFITQATTTPSSIDVNHLASRPTDPVDTTLALYASVTGLEANTSVGCVLYAPEGNLFINAILRDDGKFPDEAANDGKFSATVHLHILKQEIGKYVVQFQASGSSGFRSNTVVEELLIKNSNNHVPVISNLVMQDTAHIPLLGDTTFVRITITAADTDGSGDIVSVTLTSRDTSGSIVGVFPMFDDGGNIVQLPLHYPSGDATANDGIYTLIIPLTQPPHEGVPTYRDFSFKATDRTGESSSIITKLIYLR